MCGCLLCTPHWGPGPQPRHVLCLGIELQPFGSQASTQSTEPHQPGPSPYTFNIVTDIVEFMSFCCIFSVPSLLCPLFHFSEFCVLIKSYTYSIASHLLAILLYLYHPHQDKTKITIYFLFYYHTFTLSCFHCPNHTRSIKNTSPVFSAPSFVLLLSHIFLCWCCKLQETLLS